MDEQPAPEAVIPGIKVMPNGPYSVTDVALYRRRQVMSERGEPLTWETTTEVEHKERYRLCRCGRSGNKPFCDGTHGGKDGGPKFESLGEAPPPYDDRAKTLGGTGIVVRDDRARCEHAGFCGNEVTNVWKAVKATDDPVVRAQVIAMVERCPSGALTYRLEGGDADVEPLLAPTIGVVDDGPLFVTGGVPVALADGTPLETRNRVTLCRCGQSGQKPLCDGSHKESGFKDS